MSIGDVDPFDKNRGDIACFVLDRLEDEFQLASLLRTIVGPLKGDFRVLPNERLSGRENSVEHVNKALVFDPGKGLASGPSDHIAMPD